MRPMPDMKETLQSARNPKRRRLVRRILLALVALVALFGAYFYFFQYRLSTRNPGTLAKGTAPEFTLNDETGKATSLASLTAHGPAVLVFYRGYW